MIFFADNDGTITSSVPSPVYQGSANVNNIYLVAPLAINPTTAVAVAFILPNGVITVRDKMTPIKELDGIINKHTGEKYSVWSYSPDIGILQRYGTVTVQFFFYGSQDGVITATSSTSFTVGKGVPSILPPDNPPADIYNKILNHLTYIQEQIDNSYQAGFADSMQVVTKTLPEGEPARVDVTPVADTPPTAKAFKFDFFIPKGDLGEKGYPVYYFDKELLGYSTEGSLYSFTPKTPAPIVGNIVVSNDGYIGQITSYENGSYIVQSLYKIKGDKGDKGDTWGLTGLRVDYNTQTGEINVNNDIYATALASYGRYTYVDLTFNNGDESYNLPFAGCFISPNHGESGESYCDIEYNDGTHRVIIRVCDDSHRNSISYANIKTDTVSFFVGEDGLMHYKVL